MPNMRRLNLSKNSNDPTKRSGSENHSFDKALFGKCGLNWMTLLGISVACLMGLSGLFSVSVVLQDIQSNSLWALSEKAEILVNHRQASSGESHQSGGHDEDNSTTELLATGFEMDSCLSRHQSKLYRKESPYNPSALLLSKLRSYEALHKRCGPHTLSYNTTVELLRSGREHYEVSDCNYLVWISFSGLGNKILSIASAFLYALLTDRVLLIDRGTDIGDLFCEPFPDTAWLLPLDFPLIDQFHNFDQKSPQSYGNMLRNNMISNSSSSRPPWTYLHLVHDYDDYDKLFFCDQDQSIIQRAPWLIMKTDNYFIPSLFLIPSFEQQLNNLFPQKETVFHFLGRYLFHPTNLVWGLIARYYDTYLAKANEKIGIQIRVFDTDPGPFQHVFDQIVACTVKEGLLPELNEKEEVTNLGANQKLKAVLVTSLSSGYSEKLKSLYWDNPTVTGEVISVYQPSHEGYQNTENQIHDKKAWAEMYLLSLTDVLVTSSWSTFGYVAQGIGGLKPWLLYKPENRTVPNPPCSRDISMEPCFHAPPFYDCKAKTGVDTGKIVPHVRHCQDMGWGLKLVDK